MIPRLGSPRHAVRPPSSVFTMVPPSPVTLPVYNIPMKLVPLYGGDLNIGSTPLITNLDT